VGIDRYHLAIIVIGNASQAIESGAAELIGVTATG
jgi:hypothetical protein